MGEKRKRDYELGVGLLTKAHASKSKSAFKRFYGQAVEHIRRAAYSGNANAQFELGLQYEDTGFLGENMKKAMYWYMKAAENGHAEACNNIGFNYYHGVGVKKDPRKAIAWYRKGALRGSVLAQQNLAKSMKSKSDKGRKYYKDAKIVQKKNRVTH